MTLNLKSHLRTALAALLLVTTLAPAARADEGMWPYNNVPRAEIKKRYGFDVTDAFLKHLQLASVRFNNGGSGSFVSANGLVLTNYHIVEDVVGELSTREHNYAKDGFVAHTRAEEIKIPSLELNVLMSIEDVTARVNGAIREGMSDADAFSQRTAAISAIEAESLKATGLRSDVVTLYQGGQYNLYRYKKYTDVRLVFAPEFQAAFFGGDPDNFNYPRYNIDMALVRVYENDKPVHPTEYLKWSTTGAKAGDLVFVSGNPGSTQRLNTVAHLEYLRETGIPLMIKYLERQRALLQKYGAKGEEQARLAREDLASVENSLKSYRGQAEGLQNRTIMARKGQAEETLRRVVASDARRQKEYGDAWEQIARARKGLPAYERERRFLDSEWGFNSQLFNLARKLVRLTEESEKQNGERLPEYTDARRASLELDLYSPAPIYDEFEKMKLADSLAFMRDELGANHALVKKVLNGKTPEARIAELIEGTHLKDVAARKQLVAGGRQAIEKSDDPMIQLARLIDPESRAVRKRYEDEVVSVERASYAKIARARFELEGTKLYPDATFTLRLSYGAVKGYQENGKRVAPFTTLGGLYERAAQHKYQFPYNLPQRWLDRKASRDLKTPFNFVTTNDIGGNSGSPTVNKNGELVGLNFDRNIHGLVGTFIYDESVNRAISVDSRAMLEALRKVYGAREVADELIGDSVRDEYQAVFSEEVVDELIGDSVRDEYQAVFSKPVKINAESSNLLKGEAAALKTRQEALRAKLAGLEAQPRLELRKGALLAAASEAKQNLIKTRGVFLELIPKPQNAHKIRAKKQVSGWLLERIESGLGLGSTEETRRAAQTFFHNFELEYDKTLQDIKELTPGNYTSVRDNTLQLLDFNASAYAVIASNQSLTFNLIVKSNPPQSAIYYKRKGDPYTLYGSETNATIENLIVAKWYIRVEHLGYVPQEKLHIAQDEMNHVVDFQLEAEPAGQNVQPTIKQASPGGVPKSASKLPKKASKAKTVHSGRKH